MKIKKSVLKWGGVRRARPFWIRQWSKLPLRAYWSVRLVHEARIKRNSLLSFLSLNKNNTIHAACLTFRTLIFLLLFAVLVSYRIGNLWIIIDLYQGTWVEALTSLVCAYSQIPLPPTDCIDSVFSFWHHDSVFDVSLCFLDCRIDKTKEWMN